MANSLSLTQFISMTGATFLSQISLFVALSSQYVDEFVKWGAENQRGYKPGDVVAIKKTGYPTVQRGLAITTENIVDETIPYTATNDDIYNVAYEISIREEFMDISGAMAAFTQNPFTKDGLGKAGRHIVDNYAVPAARALQGQIDIAFANKCRQAAFYTPLQRPADLKVVNSFADISAANQLADELGFPPERYAIMNTRDAKNLLDSLQNMFNQRINTKITETATISGSAQKAMLGGFEFYKSNTVTSTPNCAQWIVNPNSTGFRVVSVASDFKSITFTGAQPSLTPAIVPGTLIAIPTVNLINRVNKKVLDQTLVICATNNANSDASGNVTVTFDTAIHPTGPQAVVNSLPGTDTAAEVFPGHNNNYFFVPMGLVSSHLPLAMIHGASNGRYYSEEDNISMQSFIQGVSLNAVNSIRISSFIPTLAIGDFLINVPSPLVANS